MNILRKLRGIASALGSLLPGRERAEDAERAAGERAAARLARFREAKFRAAQKLGPSWHTRRLSAGTRARRLFCLTRTERAVARKAGWIA